MPGEPPPSVEPEPSACLDDAALVALAEGALDPDAREQALRHVDGCPICAELVGQAARLASEERTALGRYLVLSEIGAGAMGRVCLAYDPELRREVALKVVRSEAADPVADARRLMKEARALARLDHPNVVSVFDLQSQGSEVFIAMEFVPGVSIDRWLAQQQRSREEILEVFAAAAEGLEVAHAAGVVHRDFKPSNVLVTAQRRVVVVDFGLAVAAQPSTLDGQGRFGAGTSTAGTPLYMAPEQYGGVADARSDQYAFCFALVEALTGDLPLTSPTVVGLRDLKQRGELDPNVVARLPRRIAAAVLRGLRVDPAQRWPTIGELRRALEARRGRRGVWVISLAVAACVAAALLWPASHPSPCAPSPDRFVGVWDADLRTRAAGAFEQTGLEYSTQQLERVAVALDGYAGHWYAVYGEVCGAGQQPDAESGRLLDARMRCLQSRLDALAAFSGALVDADAELVRSSLEHASRLPELAPCLEQDLVLLRFPSPVRPEVESEVRTLMADLARAQLAANPLHSLEGLPTAESLVARARVLDYPPAVLRALDLRSKIAANVGAPEAMAFAEEAYDYALAQSDDEYEADAAMTMAIVHRRSGDYEQVQRWLDLARLGVERSDKPSLRGRLATRQADLYLAMGELEQAIREFQRAEGLMAAADRDGIGHAKALNNLAGAYRFVDNAALATHYLEQARRRFVAAGGPHHPSLVGVYVEQAAVLLGSEEFEAAATASERGLELLLEAKGPTSKEVANARQGLAMAYRELGRYADATRELEAALAAANAVKPDPHELALTWLLIGTVRERQKEHAGADAAYRSGIGVLDEAGASARTEALRADLIRHRERLP